MTTGLPSQTQVIELLGGEFARAGYEIEDVVIDTRARPPRITVIADGDTALDLDTIATLVALGIGFAGRPGQHPRPLRARGQLARRGPPADQREALPPGARPQGRTGAVGRIAADRPGRRDARTTRSRWWSAPAADWAVREIPLDEIVKAVVQVEFSPPAPSGAGTGDWVRRGGAEHEPRRRCRAEDRRRMNIDMAALHAIEVDRGISVNELSRDDQIRAAHRLPAHRGPPERRAHRDRPQDRRRPGDRPGDRRRRQRHQ